MKGAVPVEVTEEIPADIVEKIAAAICPGDYCEAHSECRDCVPEVWAAAYPLIAARVRADERQRIVQEIDHARDARFAEYGDQYGDNSGYLRGMDAAHRIAACAAEQDGQR